MAASDEIPLEAAVDAATAAVAALLAAVLGESVLPEFVWSANDPARHGKAPIGYLEGMALTYARAYCNYGKDPRDPFVGKMGRAVAPGVDPRRDAVAKYRARFDGFGADVSADGVHVLRAVFTILFSLGMRESDGRHCTGWDRAKKTGWGNPSKKVDPTPENSEAGLFQVSFDVGIGVPGDFRDLYTRYRQAPLSGFRDVFAKGVACSAADWENFGDPTVEASHFQELSKQCPAFAVELAALGLRGHASHWGPINRNEVEIAPEAWELLLSVERAIDDSGGCAALAT